MLLQQEERNKTQAKKYLGIGFEIYYNDGKKLNKSSKLKMEHENGGGYQIVRDVSLEVTLKPKNKPYTMLLSTFYPNEEASFIFTIWSFQKPIQISAEFVDSR